MFTGKVYCLYVKSDTDEDAFYDRLGSKYHKALRHDVNIVMRDQNIKVGKEMVIHKIRIHSLHDISNDNGLRLSNFA